MKTAWVLMYHNVGPEVPNAWYVSPAQLQAQLQSLKEQGCTIGDLRTLLAGKDNVVCITFDDASVNVYTHAFPILQSFGLTATVSVPVNLVGGMNTYDWFLEEGIDRPERIMSWEQLGELQASGWSIQSHGCSHVPLNKLLREHVEDEILRSKMTIEDRLGAEVFAYAYAYGALPDPSQVSDVAELFQGSGYRLALLAMGGATPTPPPDPFQVNRVIVTGDTHHLRLDPASDGNW